MFALEVVLRPASRREILLVMTALSLVLITLVTVPSQDRSTPDATVRGFFAEIDGGNLGRAARYVKGGQPDRFKDGIESIKSGSYAISGLSVTVNGNRASARYTIVGGANDIKESLKLVRQSKIWLIDPPTKEEAKKLVGGSYALLLANPEVGGTLFTEAKAAALRAQCISNMKQHCMATIMFAVDNNDVLALKDSNFRSKVQDYAKSSSLWRCPAAKSEPHPYSFNDKLSGKRFEQIKHPAKTVMFYEGKNGKLNFRHDGKAVVGFVDGRASAIAPAEAKSLLWTAG